MVSEDYATRSIRDMARTLTKMVLNEEAPLRTFPEGSEEGAGYLQLTALADAGEINEAENRLLEWEDPESPAYFRLAMAFYLHLNEMPEDFLDSYQYSKEEVAGGIQALGEAFGYFYDADLLL